jgi:hypothetical protein
MKEPPICSRCKWRGCPPDRKTCDHCRRQIAEYNAKFREGLLEDKRLNRKLGIWK